MHNFLRILGSATRYRWTIFGIFASSTMVALLWGANIGALFPVIKVAVKGKSIQDWLDEEIEKSRVKIDELNIQIAGNEIHHLVGQRTQSSPWFTSRVDGNEISRRSLSVLNHDRNIEQRALKTFQWAQPKAQRYLPDDPFQTIVVIVGALIVGTGLKGFFIFCNLMLVARLHHRTTFDLRRRFFHKCLSLDQLAFGKQRTSRLLSQFNADVGYASAAVKALAGPALREPLKMLACLIGASIISPRLLLFSLILTPITVFTIKKLAGSIKRANRRSLEEFSSLYGVITEAFQGIETVHAFTLERHQRGKFFQKARACFEKGMQIAFYNAMTKPVTEVLGICVIALALLSGAYLTINEATHIGPIRMLDRPIAMESLMLFFGFLIGATEPARKLSEVFNAVQAGVAASDRLMPLFEQQPSIQTTAHPVAFPRSLSTISFKDVTFHYSEETPVLVNLDLEVRAGEAIAIVGPNGCGKTTLINLIPRFHDPVSGSVQINGIDLRQLNVKQLRSEIGFVTQRSLLFDDTVYENIRHGRLDASQAEIVRAAKQARADRFIHEKLTDGYDTVIGAGGSNLSGGQRQRVALARAMVRDPKILILDEATSQIDLESEQLIHQALEQFGKGRTMIIITHRLATLELAHRVVVMNHGQVEDVGTHAELLDRCELYQRLHELQFKRSA